MTTCGASGTNYDTVLYVKQGSCAAADLQCSDDAYGCDTASGPYHGSTVSIVAQAGTTYYILVDGYNGRNGTFTLHLTPPF
jgi:hypothetical protein